jgi:hypothetical protein
MSFQLGATISSAQPVCGVNPETITPASSGTTLAISDVAYGVVGVTISDAAWGSKCEVSLVTWNGINRSSLSVMKASPDCSFVSFSAKDVGFDFGFSAAYSFELAEYSNTAANTAVVNPVATKAASNVTIGVDLCATTNMLITQIDKYSISVSINGGKPYAACRVTITKYGTTSVSIVRVGLCSSYFKFTDSAAFASGLEISLKYEFFPDGDITGNPSCASSVDERTLSTPNYSCGQAPLVSSSQLGLYVFDIAKPEPMIGKCKLLITNCDGPGALTDKEISFPSCSSSLALSYTDIVGVVSNLNPGRQCSFVWRYYDLADSKICDYAGSAVTANIYISLNVTATTTSSSINVTLAALPAALTTYLGAGTAACYARNTGCSSTPVATPSDVAITSCSGTVSLTANMTSNSNCLVEVVAYASTDNTKTYPLATSGKLSFPVAAVPAWGDTQVPTITLYGDSCMEISWSTPSSNGGAPILCYEVQRKDADGSYYVVKDCTIGDTSESAISCGFTTGVDYKYQVIAINRNGRSVDSTCVSITQRYEYLLSAPDSIYTTPSTSQKNFVAGGFPSITVQAKHPLSPVADDSVTSDRLFVSTLVSRCKLDATLTLKVPLSNSDTDYTSAELPIPPNSPPALTQVFEPVQGSAGFYRLVPQNEPLAGAYSVITYSLETGGLLGYYWSNPFFDGATPTMTRKDPVMNFVWELDPLINSTTVRFYVLVSIRWTGFIEAAYTEKYVIFVEANSDQVRLWIDDVIIINNWDTDSLCNEVCVGSVDLQQSSATGGRKFSSIRIDFVHSKGPAQAKPAKFTLKWTSMSQSLEVIPPERLFKSLPITPNAKTITVIPGDVQASSSTFELNNEAFTTDKNYKIIVYAKDSYGNILQTADSRFYARFTKGGQNSDFLSVPIDASLNNGTYYIPFRLTSEGDYTVTIKETVSGGTISGGSFSIHVSTGLAYSVTSVADVGSPHYADEDVTFTFEVKDASDNEIDGSDLTTMPPVHVSALWLYDATTQSRLPVDDVTWRSTRYGVLFTNATIAWASTQFSATIRLPRQGNYTVSIGIDGGAAPDVLTPVAVSSSPVSLASYALITTPTSLFPPTDLTVGVLSEFTVQLRDKYMNAISVTPSGSPVVNLRLQKNGNDVLCVSQAPASAGQYKCSITPTISGAALAFSILVDGAFASYAYDNAGTIMYSRAPWYVDVSPGAVSATYSVLTGVRKIYVAGVAADATLLLRDTGGNNLGPVSSWPVIAASLGSVTMDPSTFIYDAAAGIVTIPIVSSIVDNSATLSVTIDGIAVSLPSGITAGGIQVIKGQLSVIHSPCQTFVNAKAGTSFTNFCLPKDSESNAITWANLNTYATFVHKTDKTLSPIVATGLVDGTNAYKWDYGTTSLTKTGEYWYYILMAQPGGLIGKYYALSGFSSLIGIGGTPESIVLSGDVSPTLYTKLDQFLDFDLNGPIVVNGTTATSVSWVGQILGPATQTVTFKVVATGGVRVRVGATDANYLSATSVDTTFNVSMTLNTYYAMQVDYLPSTTAALSIKWSYTGAPIAVPFVVPPSALHSLFNVATSLNSVTVNVADISSKSTAIFSSGIVAGNADFIIVQATDQYGNDFTSALGDSDCLATGTSPTCFFTASMVVDDGTTFDHSNAVALAGGKIKIPVTFATDGPKKVSIVLKLSSGTAAIQGSPYDIIVNPNPTPR